MVGLETRLLSSSRFFFLDFQAQVPRVMIRKKLCNLHIVSILLQKLNLIWFYKGFRKIFVCVLKPVIQRQYIKRKKVVSRVPFRVLQSGTYVVPVLQSSFQTHLIAVSIMKTYSPLCVILCQSYPQSLHIGPSH